MNLIDYIFLVGCVAVICGCILFTCGTMHKSTQSLIRKNHTEVMAQIQKQIEADTKFINALEAALKGE